MKEQSKFSFKKIWNQIRSFFSKPANVILVFFAILLTIAVVYPLYLMVRNAFVVNSVMDAQGLNDAFGTNLKTGNFTFLYWPSLMFSKVEGFSQNVFWIPLGKSVLMALIACVIAVLSGGVLAWFISRTNLPCKKFISTVFIFPYIMPSWSIAMFWENFFKNTSISACGFQMGMLESMTGIQVPESMLYGFWPCAIVLGIHYAPFAYILIGGILRNMDANLEEAATILKASKFKILRRITIPIVAPALISTVLLVFASSISSYTVPYFLNKNGSFTSISIAMKGMLQQSGSKGRGYVIAVVLLIFSVLILSINNWFTKSKRNFTTVSGKSGQISKTNLKKFKWVFAVVIILFVGFFSIVPLVSFVLESLLENSGDLSTLTFKYWFSSESFDIRITNQGYSAQGIFHNSTIWNAFGRSVALSVIVSLIAGTFGILIGYAVSKNRRGKLAGYVSSLAFLPYLIPALSFGAVFFALMTKEGFEFLNVSKTNNEWSAVLVCILAGGFKFLPFASRSGTNAMLQLSGEIEEAAIITGCPWWKRMTRILFPIQKSSFISGYLLPFISCMRELTLFALLTSSFTLITNVLQYYQIYGLNQIGNAINLLIVIFVIAMNLIVNAVTGASIDKGIGG